MLVCSFTDFADIALSVEGREYRFAFSKRFGPTTLGERGQPIALPPRRSPFWDALHAWCHQGHQMSGDRCVFTLPPKRLFVRLVGRHYVEVPTGADPATVRREWFEKAGLPIPEDGCTLWESQ